MDRERRKSEENTDSVKDAFNSEATGQENRYTGGYLQLYGCKAYSQRHCNLPQPGGSEQPVILAYRTRYKLPKAALSGFEYSL